MRLLPRAVGRLKPALTRLCGLAGALLIVLLGLVGVEWGEARAVPAAASRKNALEFFVAEEAGTQPTSIGFASGGQVNDSAPVFDGQIPVLPSAFRDGGNLRFYRLAISHLEDRQFEWGLGVNTSLAWAVGKTTLGRVAGVRSWARRGGGSSIADQACGVALFGTRTRGNRWTRKIRDIGCGIALARQLELEDILAIYATHAPLTIRTGYGVELTARAYFGLGGGTNDPGFTRGHQAVAAAMVGLRFDERNAQKSANAIRERAVRMIDGLVSRGLLTPADRDVIAREIASVRFPGRNAIRRRLAALKVSDEYVVGVAQAAREIRGRFGSEWREFGITQVTLTVSPRAQVRAHLSCRDATLSGSRTQCIVAAVDAQGRLIALESRRGRDAMLAASLQLQGYAPGSVGKLILAAALAHLPANVRESRFRRSLARSSPDIIEDARRLGIDPGRVMFGVRCLGRPWRAEDPIRLAAFGHFDTSPELVLEAFHAMYERRPWHRLSIVDTVRVWLPENSLTFRPMEGRLSPDCLAFFGSPRAVSFLGDPVWGDHGTLAGQNDILLGGKTGTVVPAGGLGTNQAWAVAAAAGLDGTALFFVGGLGDFSNRSTNIGNDVDGSVVAERLVVPVAQVLARGQSAALRR